MIKVGILALVATALTFASALALDNLGAERAANAFAQYGLQGLGLAGRASLNSGGAPFGSSDEPSLAQRSYTPGCWTRYVTVANGNTLMNVPYTICR